LRVDSIVEVGVLVIAIHEDAVIRVAHRNGLLVSHIQALLHLVLGCIQLLRILLVDWHHGNYLDLAILGEEFHFGRAVEEHLTWNGWHWIGQVSQLIATMSETAILSKLTNTSLLKVAANLGLIVAVDGANVMLARKVLRHRLHKMTESIPQ
jgi:hypothetical protein